MTAIKATVRKGRLELDEPLDLPDGTELYIPIPGTWDDRSDEPMPPEEIARVMALMDRAQPVEMTEEEIRAWEESRAKRKEYEKSQFMKWSNELKEMWS